MEILILNWRDIKHPLSGGAEISLFEQAKYWIKKGASVTWFASSFSNATREEIIEGIKIVRNGSQYSVHLWAFWNYQKRVLGDPDVVIDCFHFVPFFTPFYIKKTKIIALINEPAKDAWFKNIGLPLSIIGFLLEPLFFIPYKNCSFITGSKSIAGELKDYSINPKLINVINHGIELNNHSVKMSKEKYPVIIYLSQLSPDKGVEDALYSFAIVKSYIKNVKLWLVGRERDQQYLSKIKRLIKKYNLENFVLLFGYVPERKKFELLSKAWILIHPSIREGWGLNVIEANSMGTPAIGYNVVGLRDSIQNNYTGLLVNHDEQSLAESIIKLIKDKKLYIKLSSNSLKWANNFSWEKCSEKSWELIKQKKLKN